MTTEKFAIFIKEERTRLGLTQTELAEKLHVSTAAVSKWERAKCLPDIAKLDEIAEVLGVTVLEVLQCERTTITEDEALPAVQDVAEKAAENQILLVYRETMDAVTRQNTSRRRKLVKLALAVILMAVLLYSFPVYHILQVWMPSYYTTGEISMLAYRGSGADLAIAATVMERAEDACEDLGLTREEAEAKYGKLARYCHPKDSYPDVVAENHDMRLWAARFGLSEGYMWVYYSQEGMDADGEVTTGSWRIPSLWYLQPDENGKWQVVHIKEHP